VSGQGLREGIALATLGKSPAPARAVRQASIEALVRRFATCKRDVARRRVRIARRLLEILEPRASDEMREVLDHVCTVLDIGRSVDYYDRHRNAAMIVLAADLQGFAPRGIALVYAVLVQADRRASRLKSLRPVLRPKDGKLVDRVAVLLLLADEIERRSLPGHPVHVRHRLGPQAFGLAAESLRGWRPRALADRFAHAFGRELRVGPA
jgi:exopolyphosphatase/guanosine-5'-triphosphate,3'-diphosphate pyrophosphatase